jgi:hypothetical protein
MRYLFFLLLAGFTIGGCKTDKPETPEEAFIYSLHANDFNLLNEFLPDREFYNSIKDKMPERTEEEIKKFLDESNERVKEAWQNTIFNAAQNKVDLKKVKIKEVIYYDPFLQDQTSEALIINYEYKGRTWDDLQFIVRRYKGKTYLLGIPNPTRSFSMSDPDLRATNEANAWLEMQQPEFKKNLEDKTAAVIKAAKANDLNTFGQLIIYRGEDVNRQWKSGLNLNDSLEREMAAQFIQKVKAAVAPCDNYETSAIQTARESEGLWIILPLRCGKKLISFAYLRVKGQYLVADMSEGDQ